MRRSVFLALWLSLVLSLSKGTSAQEDANTTVTATTTPAATTSTTIPTAPTTTPSTTVSTSPASPGTSAPEDANTTVTATTTPAAATSTTIPTAPTTTPSTTVSTSPASPGTSAPEDANTTVTATTTPAATTSTTIPTAPTTTPSTTVSTSPASPETNTSTSTPVGPATTPNTTVSTSPPSPETNTSTTTPASPATKPNTTVSTSPASPGTSAETPANTTVTATPTPAVDFCSEHPCGRNLAKCISLKSSYTCECEYGFYYSNQNCFRGKVYPATFAVRGTYSDSVKDVNSTEYEEVFHNVSQFFGNAFQMLNGYVQTVIMEIQPLKETRNSLPRNVTVTNLFLWNSTESADSIKSAVERAINAAGSQSYVNSYKVANDCDVYPCDTKTTTCQVAMFPECICNTGLEKIDQDDRSCPVCSKDCSSALNKHCVTEEGVPKCRCMNNFELDGPNCVPCRVGYSGDNCTDNTELILIIVGTVFGAIILSLVIAVSVVSVRAKRKQHPEKRSLIKPGYSDLDSSDDRPSMFPRVQTTSGHANPGYQPNNPYEMRSTNRGHFPERDYDDLYEASREPGGFRMHSRY